MYSYNLKQLRALELIVDRSGWIKAFEYLGYYGQDNGFEVDRILELGLLGYLAEHTATKREIDEIDFAVNYLCELYNLK